MEQRTTPMPVIAGVLILVSEGMKFLAAVFLGFILIWPVGFPPGVIVILVYLVMLGVAVAGGVAALQRRSWGLALAGAIVAALPFSLFGIAAIVLVALSQGEFKSGRR